MNKRQPKRVQHHPRRGKTNQFFQPPVLSLPISQIADEWITEKLKMHANLMRAAGVQPGLDECRRPQSLQDAIARARLASRIVAYGHALTMRWMSRDGGADFAFVSL